VLLDMMDLARSHVDRILDGLTDQEFFWEPVPGCWTVRRRHGEDVHWAPGRQFFVNGKGEWVIDYAVPDPIPAPLTTIAWRLVHMAGICAMYHEHVFGPARLDWDDWEIPHAAADALRWWAGSFDAYRRALERGGDTDLDREAHAVWGPTQTVRQWSEVLIHENAHHGAEIGALRDLHRATGGGSTATGTRR
jgi:hypothetical protein